MAILFVGFETGPEEVTLPDPGRLRSPNKMRYDPCKSMAHIVQDATMKDAPHTLGPVEGSGARPRGRGTPTPATLLVNPSGFGSVTGWKNNEHYTR